MACLTWLTCTAAGHCETRMQHAHWCFNSEKLVYGRPKDVIFTGCFSDLYMMGFCSGWFSQSQIKTELAVIKGRLGAESAAGASRCQAVRYLQPSRPESAWRSSGSPGTQMLPCLQAISICLSRVRVICQWLCLQQWNTAERPGSQLNIIMWWNAPQREEVFLRKPKATLFCFII